MVDWCGFDLGIGDIMVWFWFFAIRLSVKKKIVKPKVNLVKKKKAGKDPNKPKRPLSAFFVFMCALALAIILVFHLGRSSRGREEERRSSQGKG